MAEETALDLVDEFAAFGPAYARWVRSQLRGGGISYARVGLLGALRCGGPGIMSSLSEELGVTKRNVTALVDALEREGLVRRRAHPTDRRATVVELTGAGERAAKEIYDEHRAAVAGLFEGLHERDRRELLRLMGELREILRRGCPAG